MHLVLAALIVATVMPVPEPVVGAHVPGRFVVSSGDLTAAGVETVLGHAVVEVTPQGDPHEQAGELSRRLGVTVEPMVMYQMFDAPVAEPLFDDQWALRNTGQLGGTPGADISVEGAWPWATGTGVVVAVIDSGVASGVPDLVGALWVNTGEMAGNGVDDDSNGFVDDRTGWDFIAGDAEPEDVVGHGTAVASVVAARTDGTGIAGVAPDVRLMAIRTCSTFGCPADTVARGIVYAVDNGADVINISLGAPGAEPLVTAAVDYALSNGVLVVAAAGNNGEDIDVTGPWTPVSVDGVLGVAWTTPVDRLAAASNRGVIGVEVAAPGELILSAGIDGGYEPRTGTSFAAPHVAGVAALMKSVSRHLTPAEITALLTSTGDHLDTLVGEVGAGGRIDAARAVQGARFRDIPFEEFADDIMWAADGGLTRGCTPTLFCPDGTLTRGQMAAFLARLLDLPETDADAFTDDDGSVFESDVDRLAAVGITTGCGPTSFCPDDPVTRAQMAAFLVRAFDPPTGVAGAFGDDDGSVFEQDIEALAAAGITQGCNPPDNDRFCPDDPVTRGQLMAFLRRA